jgi:HipA-like protein
MQTHQATNVLATRLSGSSWPLIVETSGGVFLTKLRGAGHGPSALVAEVIVARIADHIGLHVPRQSLIVVDEDVTCDDPDPELLDLLAASHGLNLGFELLEGASDFRPDDCGRVSGDDAATVAWLDWLVMNPDRTWRNPNLLMCEGALWLIDHGSALMFHHNWRAVTEESPRTFLRSLSSHPLATSAKEPAEWDALLSQALDRDAIRAAVSAVPDDFLFPLVPAPASASAVQRRREAYAAFLWKRLKPPRRFVEALAGLAFQ